MTPITLDVERFAAGGTSDLSPQQVAAAGERGILGFAPDTDLHAEQKVLSGVYREFNPSLVPLAIAATNGFCGPEKSGCGPFLEAAGAIVLDPEAATGFARRRAIWPAGG